MNGGCADEEGYDSTLAVGRGSDRSVHWL